jgi:ligand-binding sensor domain-containing protein
MSIHFNTLKKLFFTVNIWIAIGLFSSLFGQKIQVPGTWQYHYKPLSYNAIEHFDKEIFAIGKYAVLHFPPNQMNADILHKINGLSDYSIDGAYYDKSSQKGILTYNNSTIDLISWNQNRIEIEPNYDLFNKIFIGAKQIFKVKFIGNKAYLSTSMGIVVLNLEQNIVESTYVIGDNGNQSNVLALENFNNTWYAISNNQIKTAPDVAAINLQDYKNWKTDLTFNDTFIDLIKVNDKLYLLTAKKLYVYNGNTITLLETAANNQVFKKIKFYNNSIYTLKNKADLSIASGSRFWVEKLENNALKKLHDSSAFDCNDFVIGDDESIFIASFRLFKFKNNKFEEISTPMAPGDNTQKLQYQNDEVIVNTAVLLENTATFDIFDGHFKQNLNNDWFQRGIWNSIYNNIRNHISAIYVDGGVYRAYTKGGVFFEKNNGEAIQFNALNSTLEGAGPENNVIDMQKDPNTGVIWVVVNNAEHPLKSIDKEGVWRNHPFKDISPGKEFRKLFIDQKGHKWMLSRNKGVVYFDELNLNDANDDIFRLITKIEDGDCSLDVSESFAITESISRGIGGLTSGLIWIGARRGIGGIYNCVDGSEYECMFTIPGQELVDPNNNQDTTFECAFLNTAISALTTDGGNRLWVGVSGAGLFYMDEDFSVKYQGISNEFLRFTKVNSPFPGNNVYDILVHPKTGNVFFSTEIGLFSYMGQSIEGVKEAPSNYKVTPNPVPQGYSGLISIDGLPAESRYKITDAVGNLIYQGVSNGGRIVWDGKDLRGQRPPTGVYFVFSAQRGTLNDAEKRVGSFTIIN